MLRELKCRPLAPQQQREKVPSGAAVLVEEGHEPGVTRGILRKGNQRGGAFPSASTAAKWESTNRANRKQRMTVVKPIARGPTDLNAVVAELPDVLVEDVEQQPRESDAVERRPRALNVLRGGTLRTAAARLKQPLGLARRRPVGEVRKTLRRARSSLPSADGR